MSSLEQPTFQSSADEVRDSAVTSPQASPKAGSAAVIAPGSRALLEEHLKGASVHFAASWSTAFYSALLVCGVTSGDEVIMPALAPQGVAHAILLTGARPVFVDVLPEALLIDPALVEAAITEHTRAVIVSHLYGQICNTSALNDTLRERGIGLIEDGSDAFCALGLIETPAEQSDILVGCLPRQRDGKAEFPAFLATRNATRHVLLSEWTAQLQRTKFSFDMREEGFSDVPMIDLVGALEEDIDQRFSHEIAYEKGLRPLVDRQIGIYQADLAALELRPLKSNEDAIAALTSYPVYVPHGARDRVFESLHNGGFGVYRSYRNLAELSFFSARESVPHCPVASDWSHGAMTLPTGSSLSRREQRFLGNAIKNSLITS